MKFGPAGKASGAERRFMVVVKEDVKLLGVNEGGGVEEME